MVQRFLKMNGWKMNDNDLIPYDCEVCGCYFLPGSLDDSQCLRCFEIIIEIEKKLSS